MKDKAEQRLTEAMRILGIAKRNNPSIMQRIVNAAKQ